jgi:hypothetical protein
MLEAAGLVQTEKVGRERLHFLNPVPLHAEAARWLARFDETRLSMLAPAALVAASGQTSQ